MGLWEDLTDKIAGRPTDAEVTRMEPKGEAEARYAAEVYDALKDKTRRNEFSPELGHEILAVRDEKRISTEAREAAWAKAAPTRQAQDRPQEHTQRQTLKL